MTKQYKITIGDRVFDAENSGRGGPYSVWSTALEKANPYLLTEEILLFLGAKIEPVEPMKVEFTERIGGNKYFDLMKPLVNKLCKVTVEEIPEPECEHKNSIIWEPHLAGARKCKDCGWVKNPNRHHAGGPLWAPEEQT